MNHFEEQDIILSQQLVCCVEGSKDTSVTIIGAGAFGTAIATVLAHNGHKVTLWCYEPQVVDDINRHHENRCYLPGVQLAPAIQATNDIHQAIEQGDVIFEAVPVAFLRQTLATVSPKRARKKLWVTLSKGIEQETLLFPTGIIEQLFGSQTRTVAVSGPNFAKELAAGVVSAATVASASFDDAQRVSNLLSNDFFKAYISQDPIGTQVGGALKNVITLALGMLDGAGFGLNTQAFVLTAGLEELGYVAQVCDGNAQTIYGLCGIGDVVLTGMGDLSRNRTFGRLVGMGKTIDEAKSLVSVLPEGVNTVCSVKQLTQKHGLNVPICSGVYDVLFAGKSVAQLVGDVCGRYG